MSKANELAGKSKDGTFEIGDAPNPNAVVMEHSKTLIGLSAAFIGLVATFSEKIIGERPSATQIVLFVGLWVFLLGGMICGVIATQSLHSFLFWPDLPLTASVTEKQRAADSALQAQRCSAAAGNCGTWLLLLAGILAAVLSIIRILDDNKATDSGACVKMSVAYIKSLPGLAASQPSLLKIAWNESQHRFDVTMEADKNIWTLTVDVKTKVVMSASREIMPVASLAAEKAGVYPPIVVTNIISNFIAFPTVTNMWMTTGISNTVYVVRTTNIVQVPVISNIIRVPEITNVIYLNPQSNSYRRWILGISSEHENK